MPTARLDENHLMAKCARCTACRGAGYQTPPMLGLGSFGAPILIVAQNPGEINQNDELRLAFAGLVETAIREEWGNDIIGRTSAAFYRADFEDTIQHLRMSRAFGRDWLSSGLFYYTNAVRCRTEFNGTPSKEMSGNCLTWTKILSANRSVIVTLGSVASEQVWGNNPPKPLTPTRAKIRSSGVVTIAVRAPHPVIWKREVIETLRGVMADVVSSLKEDK
jgi:uracil-DNA glycosylase